VRLALSRQAEEYLRLKIYKLYAEMGLAPDTPSLRGELDPLPSFRGAASSSFRREASLLEGTEEAG
jgi:hypothetical protein